MAAVLASVQDVVDMWRPLSPDEAARVDGLLWKASALLRQASPSVDDRLAVYAANPGDPSGLDPVVVATVVATMVKRFLSNVDGVASQSIGSATVTYSARGDTAARGELQVTQSDLDALRVHTSQAVRLGSIRVRPVLAPWPYGDL